jgi:hypothetical protein
MAAGTPIAARSAVDRIAAAMAGRAAGPMSSPSTARAAGEFEIVVRTSPAQAYHKRSFCPMASS